MPTDAIFNPVTTEITYSAEAIHSTDTNVSPSTSTSTPTLAAEYPVETAEESAFPPIISHPIEAAEESMFSLAPTTIIIPLRRPHSESNGPLWLTDYVSNRPSRNHVLYPISDYVSYTCYPLAIKLI